MTPTTQGRHCQACQLPVVDFSQLSDAEVVAFFERAPATRCGRFTAQQLDRPLLGAAPPPPRWRTWLTAATTLIIIILTTAGARAQAPAPNVSGAMPQPARPATTPKLPGPHSVTLRGRVLDQATNQPVPFASLGFKNLEIGTLSKEDGSFELNVSANQVATHPTDTLVVQSLGFHRSAQLIDLRGTTTDNPVIDRRIALNRNEMLVLGLIVVPPREGSQVVPEPKRKARHRR